MGPAALLRDWIRDAADRASEDVGAGDVAESVCNVWPYRVLCLDGGVVILVGQQYPLYAVTGSTPPVCS